MTQFHAQEIHNTTFLSISKGDPQNSDITRVTGCKWSLRDLKIVKGPISCTGLCGSVLRHDRRFPSCATTPSTNIPDDEGMKVEAASLRTLFVFPAGSFMASCSFVVRVLSQLEPFCARQLRLEESFQATAIQSITTEMDISDSSHRQLQHSHFGPHSSSPWVTL